MIIGLGVDLVRVSRIAAVLQRYGARFKERVFTPAEITYCEAQRQPANNYALRFAAKEAMSKALGVGLRQNGIRWREVEVIPTPSGKPELRVSGRAAELCTALGVSGMFVSLTDEGDFGVAVVVLER